MITNDIKRERLEIFLTAQIEEIYKFKWILGVELQYDPLCEYTMDEICRMWIINNANEFRSEWLRIHGSGYFEGDPDVGINNPN